MTNSKTTTVNCPVCQTRVIWNNTSPNRPFCSETCKNKDFIAWANEEHKLPGNSVYDDVLSEDSRFLEPAYVKLHGDDENQ